MVNKKNLNNYLSVACLGGTGEIGMNLYIYETDESAVIVDCGVMFTDPLFYGIDYVIPDIQYLEEIKGKLKGALFTHGHEDHIGAVAFLTEKLNPPIYATKFTVELINRKLRDIDTPPPVNTVTPYETIKFGDIDIQFLPVPHSIPDSCGLLIKGNGYTFVHISDFKTNLDPAKIDTFRLFASDKGVVNPTCLLLDSTNALNSGISGRESEIKENIYNIAADCKGKLFFTTFASNVERLKTFIETARALNRKIVIEGQAIERIIKLASQFGLIFIHEDELLDTKTANRYDDSELCYIVSGCQGEMTSAMNSISTGERRAIKVNDNDLFVFSSRTIPGNERNVNKIVDNLMRLGGSVITADDEKVHVSGHASAKELELVIKEIKPEYFIPIHGEYRHLIKHKKIAISSGAVSAGNCLIMETGKKITFTKKGGTISEIPAGRLYYDSRGGFLLDEEALKQRRNLANDGVVRLQFKIIDKRIYYNIDSYGFTFDEKGVATIKSFLDSSLHEEGVTEENFLTAEHNTGIIEILTRLVKRYFKKNYNRRPFVRVLADIGEYY